MKVTVAGLCLALASGGAYASETADLVIYDGHIITVDKQSSVTSAMVVREGKIIAVGADALARRFHAQQTIDLHGQAVVPGFMDDHLHLFGKPHRNVDLSKAGSIEEIKRLIRSKAQELGPGEWVVGNDWDETHFAEHRLPTRTDLDEAAPGNPVVLVRAGGHSVAANALAFKAAGIDRTSPNKGYVIDHDANGELTGIVREGFGAFMSKVPSDSQEQLEPSFIEALKALLPLGITSAVIAGAQLDDSKTTMGGNLPSWPEWQKIYSTMGSDLPRMSVQILWPGAEKLQAFPHHTGYGDDRLKLGAIGETPGMDGGMTGPTACTLHDYYKHPGFRGQCNVTDDQLQELLDTAATHGWQVGLHSIGDRAIQQLVAGYAQALQRYKLKDPRWFTSHFSFLPPQETLALMKKYDIPAAQQPNFAYTLYQRYVDNVDPETREHVMPVATPDRMGIHVAFGSDDLPIGPILGIYAAVTRKGPTGERLAPAEAVSVQDAIRMYTLGTAYLTWDEKKKGSLETGKFADFLVLDRNPLTIAPDDLKNMQVDMTVIGGRIVYGRQGTAYAGLVQTN